jgi:hypothetical protein
MNYCNYCNSNIPEKTAGGKPRKYCNKSCSRRHYVENNKDKLSESAKKSFKTLNETNPDAIKHRGRLTEKKRKAFEELKKTDHYQRTGKLGSAAVMKNGNLFGGKEHVKKVMIEKGRWFDYGVFDYNDVMQYTRTIRRLTLEKYGSAGKGYHWDHIVPVSVGFKLNIPPSLLCCSDNVRKITDKENISKGSRMISEGYELLDNWDIEYNKDELF